ncbi:DUF6503 family protein [Neolewinella antarctica]|uniref:Uncharacterized protein n=1 Tax=Neolewinella antarctica TaxID=442734 RepID=A0ABX0XG06_9BACT|nr:DUF6503 family protein [Neolewinella antarctica]NJC28254.1 hypothetical protein [Neolewinella antarctica]
MYQLLPILFALLTLPCTPDSYRDRAQSASNERAKAIIDRMVQTTGGMQGLHALKDVEYKYTYGSNTSTERYIFDGEISYGQSTNGEGQKQQQYFDGETATVWLDGKKTADADALKSALFTRKTNFYWLTMMQKLADPGLIYDYAGTRNYEGVDYDLVDVTFNDGVGVAKDRYLLYVNPHTHLVDQFLFTVMAFDRATPIMMKYTYDTFAGGVKLPVVSQSHSALNWEGELDPEAKWGARWRTDFKFNNGFTKNNIHPNGSK